MKAKFLLITVLTLILFSCLDENIKNDIDDNSKKSENLNIIGSEIAKLKDGKVELIFTDNEIIESFNKFSNKVKLNKIALSLEVLEIEENYYLRFYNDDESVSTIALIKKESQEKNKDNYSTITFWGGETICSSTACANCCGCIPDGDYCSNCSLDTFDCSRTTSG
jgi:hypothetical protein